MGFWLEGTLEGQVAAPAGTEAGQKQGEPRQLCTALGTLVLGVSQSRHIPGAGGGPLDAFLGFPLPRHKASFLPVVPRLPRGAWGARLGAGGGLMGCDILGLSPMMLGQGHRGRSWQTTTTDSSSQGSPPT